jgi:hypothetical protein
MNAVRVDAADDTVHAEEGGGDHAKGGEGVNTD